jgi:transcriptional regulator with XRE-family HTH domain
MMRPKLQESKMPQYEKTDGNPSEVIGRFIRERREKLGITRRELASKLGYKLPNMITMVETAATTFPLNRWEDYAEAIGVDKAQFLKLVLSTLFPSMKPYLRLIIEDSPQNK